MDFIKLKRNLKNDFMNYLFSYFSICILLAMFKTFRCHLNLVKHLQATLLLIKENCNYINNFIFRITNIPQKFIDLFYSKFYEFLINPTIILNYWISIITKIPDCLLNILNMNDYFKGILNSLLKSLVDNKNVNDVVKYLQKILTNLSQKSNLKFNENEFLCENSDLISLENEINFSFHVLFALLYILLIFSWLTGLILYCYKKSIMKNIIEYFIIEPYLYISILSIILSSFCWLFFYLYFRFSLLPKLELWNTEITKIINLNINRFSNTTILYNISRINLNLNEELPFSELIDIFRCLFSNFTSFIKNTMIFITFLYDLKWGEVNFEFLNNFHINQSISKLLQIKMTHFWLEWIYFDLIIISFYFVYTVIKFMNRIVKK